VDFLPLLILDFRFWKRQKKTKRKSKKKKKFWFEWIWFSKEPKKRRNFFTDPYFTFDSIQFLCLSYSGVNYNSKRRRNEWKGI